MLKASANKLWVVFGFLALLFLSTLVLAYPATLTLTSNLDSFSTTAIKCGDYNCTQYTGPEIRFDPTGQINQYTVQSSGASAPDFQSYLEFDHAANQMPKILIRDFTTSTASSSSFDLTFSKMEGCNAPVESVTLSDTNPTEGTGITVTAKVLSSLWYTCEHNSNPGCFPVKPKVPADLENIYSSNTKATLKILDSNNQVVGTPVEKIQEISADTVGEIVFTNVQMPKDGSYTVKVFTDVEESWCMTKEQKALGTLVEVKDTDPKASFTADPASGEAPLTITFTDQSTSFDGVSVFSLEFGDNQSETGTGSFVSTAHTYNQADTYTAKLTIFEADGDSSVRKVTITVIENVTDPGPEPYEPNDDATEATVITEGSTQTHSIVPANDIDWLKFTLTETADVVIELSGSAGEEVAVPEPATSDLPPELPIEEPPPKPYDTVMWLFDSDLNVLKFDDDSGADLYSKIAMEIGPGTYYIRVESIGQDFEIPEYNITLTASPLLPTPTAYFSVLGTFDEGEELAFVDESVPATAGLTNWAWGFGDEEINPPATMGFPIYVFTDFNCPFCYNHHQTLNKLKEYYGIWATVLNSPFPMELLAPGKFWESSINASEASGCAMDQGFDKYNQYLDILFDNQGNFTIDNLKLWAQQIGLNTTQFNTCLDSHEKYDGLLNSVKSASAQFGIFGTPATVTIQYTGGMVDYLVTTGDIGYTKLAELFEDEVGEILSSAMTPLLPTLTYGQTPFHTYQKDGTYTVFFTVKDEAGAVGFTFKKLTINDVSPSFDLEGPAQAYTGDVVTYTLANLKHGPDNITSIEWEFDPNPDPRRLEGPESVDHTWTSPGTHTVAVMVSDTDSFTFKTLDVVVQEKLHDLEVLDMAVEKEDPNQDGLTSVYLFDKLNITTNLKNKGNFNETFTVKLKDGTTVLDTKSENLSAGESKEIQFTWIPDASGFHTLTVEIEPVAGEIETSNNQKSQAVKAWSIQDTIDLEFKYPDKYPKTSESAGSTFYVWVRITSNTGEDLHDLSLTLDTDGLNITGTSNGGVGETKTYDVFNGVRTFWWKLDSDGVLTRDLKAHIGNIGDREEKGRVVSIW